MELTKNLSRSERVRMFLYEYYLGYSEIITFMRIVGGPCMVYFGVNFYQSDAKLAVAYGGFMFLFGIYYTLNPLFWILFRLDSLRRIDFNITVKEDRIIIQEPTSVSEILFDGLDKILKRKFYFSLQVSKYNKVYLPFSILTSEQMDCLNRNLMVKNTKN